MKAIRLITLCFLLLPATAVWSYSTPNVPIDDPAYRDIDKLVAFGLVRDAIYGHRPWSRREIARMVAEALKKRETGDTDSPHLDVLLARLTGQFREELIDSGAVEGEAKAVRFHPLEAVEFDYTLLDSPFRIVPLNNGVGLIDAVINPLISNREGRHYVDGNTLGLETTHTAKLSRFFSLYARPRFEVLVPNTGSSEVNPLVQQLYGKFAYKKFALEAGRDSLVWGQGEYGGLLFSNNARPLDMIKIGNDVPFRHPWIFRYLGPSQYTFFIADLGPEREFPWTFLYGFQVTFLPVSFFEIGFHHSILMGGDGAPSVRWFDPISEFFFVRRGGVSGEGSQVADHRFGGHWRLRFPWLRRMDWYVELLWDDLGRESIAANFTEQMAFTSGLSFPALTWDGDWSLRIEYSHIPAILYRHGTWISGYTLNRRLLGSEGGPDSDTILMKLTHDMNERILLSLEGNYENRDSDTYIQTQSSSGNPDRIVKVTDQPTEHRWRLGSGILWRIRKDLEADFHLGYEHVWNFGFSPNEDVDNFLGSASLTWRP